jgi:hypothetical protein
MSAFAQSCDLEGDGYRVRLSRVLTAIRDDLTVNTSDPSRVMMRQIAGLFPQYEKARLVAKLRAARQRKRETAGKCEGRRSHAEARPELVALVRYSWSHRPI